MNSPVGGDLTDKQRELSLTIAEYQRLRGEGKDTRQIITKLIDLYHSMIEILTSTKPQTEQVVNLRNEYTANVQKLESEFNRPSTEWFPNNGLFLVIGLCIAVTLLIILLWAFPYPSSSVEIPPSTTTMSPLTTSGV